MRQGHVDGLDVSVDDYSHPCAGEDFADVLNRLTAERVLAGDARRIDPVGLTSKVAC
jgi:hypothetical protein